MSKSLSNLQCYSPRIIPWIILFFAALNVIFLGGKRRAFGGFVAVLRKEFSNITLSELNWIGDSYSALGFCSTGLSTATIIYFNRRYDIFQLLAALFVLVSCITSAFVPNPHWLFLTHTLFHGIGSSLVLSIVGLVVIEYFDNNHPYHIMATTLISGGSLASIVFVSFFAFIIEKYSWRIAFIILGGLYFGVIGLAAVFFRKNETKTNLDGKKLSFHCPRIGATQIPALVIWFVDRVMTSVVTYGLVLNLTDYLYRIDPALLSSSILTTIYAAGEGLSYLSSAVITAVTKDFFKNKIGYILLTTSVISGASLTIFEFTSHILIARRFLCFIAGLALGFSNSLSYAGGEELTGLPGHVAYPFSLAGIGLGMLISPLLSAKIAETFAYKWFFLVQGLLVFLKAFCLAAILILFYCYKKFDIKSNYHDLDLQDDSIEDNPEFPDETTKLVHKSESKDE